MKCLIIAAGKGSRLSKKGDTKPLVPLLGLSLIERVIVTAKKSGLSDFYVVTGYNGKNVKCFLEKLALRRGVKITTITNEEWKKENGVSVLKANELLNENFILLMGDHIFNGDILKRLKGEQVREGEVILAVDYNTNGNHWVDIDDVTKVYVDEGKIVDIGKHIARYNAYDTGIFLCSQAVFQAIKTSIVNNGKSSLSGGIKLLAEKGKVKAFDIKNNFWIDVDDAKAFQKAEKVLLERLKKSSDGPISRYCNRPLSAKITRYLIKTRITPNQISFFSFLLSLVAALSFFVGNYSYLALGAVLAQLSSIIDGCDGEVARLKELKTDFGGWFDAVLDRYADAFLLFGLTWYVYSLSGTLITLFIGFLAIIGTFMNSYTADKYDGLMKKKISQIGSYFRIGRDVRIAIIFLGCLINQPFITLLVIASLMNIENVRRILVLYRDGNDIGLVKKKIEEIIKNSPVPEDPLHAKNTLEWLLRLKPDADEALKIAALGHDIERAMEERKVRREDFSSFDDFKKAHALNSARIMAEIMKECTISKELVDDVFSLVVHHETGGDERANVLKEADTLSYFDVNLPLYYTRHSIEETKRRFLWGYEKLSANLKEVVAKMNYRDKKLASLLHVWILNSEEIVR